MNIRDRRAIHQAAGQSLAEAKGDPRKILIIYLLIVSGLTLTASAVSVILSNRIAETGGLGNIGLRAILSTGKSILPMVQSVILLGLELGYCTMALRISRGEAVSTDTLFGGFRRFFPLVIAQMLQGAIYLLAALLCLYPSTYIFLMLPSSESFQQIITHAMGSTSTLNPALILDEATMAAASEALLPMLWIFFGLYLLLLIPLHYRYRMVIYRLIDHPRARPMLALLESRAMMRRNRFALFRLDLNLWWFYLLQALIMVVCYGDALLPLLGVTLPFSSTVSYFLFMTLSLILQFVVYHFSMNRVSVTYATAYNTLLKEQEEQAAPVPANPWQNQY